MSSRILIIEDDPHLNQQISDLLLEAGYQVDSRFDGESGLLAASSQQHQLVLLDLMLPKRDGISMLSILRKTSQIPVIIVTEKGPKKSALPAFGKVRTTISPSRLTVLNYYCALKPCYAVSKSMQ
jgi:two-component system response regulator PfeR